jgi:transcriptional repressor NrdR
VCRADDTKVVDSRTAEDGGAIRRRRRCTRCGHRFTTFERVGEVPLVVVKRSGQREPFDRAKVVAGLRAASKGRPVTDHDLDAVAAAVEQGVRASGREVTSGEVGVAVLDALRPLDEVAYLRFASVYKGFDAAADFERELTLLGKGTAPKRR